MRLAVLAVGVDTPHQRILVGSSEIQMAGVMVHVIKYGSPSGTMRLELLDASENRALTQADVAISSIPSGNYWHGMIRFDLAYSLRRNTNYYIAMTSTGGYSYGASDYFGVVLADSLSFSGNGGMDIRILEYKNFNRGRA